MLFGCILIEHPKMHPKMNPNGIIGCCLDSLLDAVWIHFNQAENESKQHPKYTIESAK